MNDVIFDSPYGVFRDLLERYGICIHTYDKGDLSKADKIITFNHNPYFLTRCKRLGIPKERIVLFIFEPATHIPEQHTEKVWKHYGTIFTVRDDLVDNKRFFKVRFPQGQKFISELPGFTDRLFLTLINANKYSYEPNDLYSLRRSAIRFFDNYNGFDLYGHGWNDKKRVWSLPYIKRALYGRKIGTWITDIIDAQKPFVSNRGSVDDKYLILTKYKFCICFENESNVPGYITEKIFDCFFTGSVPIYYGASNITQYVPKGCFIDFTKFKNFEELADALLSMKKREWESYHFAGQRYLRTEQFKQWRPEEVFSPVVRTLVNQEL